MQDLLARILSDSSALGAEFAEIRVVARQRTSVGVQDGRADKLAAASSQGAGVRALVDGAWGFAPTNSLAEADLRACLRDAVSLARAASARVLERARVREVDPVEVCVATKARTDPRDVPLETKVAKAFELEQAGKAVDPERIVNTKVNYSDSVTVETVANTLGTFVEQTITRCGVSSSITAQEGDVRQNAGKHRHASAGYELIEAIEPVDLTVEAANKALRLLKADLPPAGKFRVILDPAVTGLYVHEALGHNSEADAVKAGESILEGKMGQQIGSELVSVIDDSTIEGKHGSYLYDSEGTPGARRVIVENGVLVGMLHSLETAAHFDVAPNGSARADGHQSPPIIRMSNTFIAPGDWDLDEMIADTRHGIYLTGGYWGYVFTAQGQFTCNIEQAYMIEGGQLGKHLRNVSVSGLTLQALHDIDAVGKDLRFELGGNCGKNGQTMPVDAGGPHVRVKELVVGGRA
jgi:TldD protein